MAAAASPKVLKVTIATRPHNGEGKPELQFPDPVDGTMIGGQIAATRMAMRVRSTVNVWARRQGKTTEKQFRFVQMAALTTGKFYAGIVFPDHATAFKIFDNFRMSWGGLVRDYKGDDKSQDRWIDLHAIRHEDGPPPTWFTEPMRQKWERTKKEPNTSFRCYFWSGKHPHYQGIQGFPHPFHVIDFDECPQIHRGALAVVRPMLNDVMGHESFSCTPLVGGIGQDWISDLWDLAGDDSTVGHWFRMSIPDGTNPHVPPTDLKQAMKSMTEAEIRQTLFAEFLNDQGAIFSNLPAVFVLKALPTRDPSLAWISALLMRAPVPSLRYWVAQAEPQIGRTYIISIDWSRSPTGDYSALTVWDMTTLEQAAVFRWRGEDFNEQMEWVLSVQRHYHAAECHSDANGMGEPMSDFMRRRHAVGFRGHKFGRNKADYVRRGQILFREGAVRLIKFDEQWAEFRGFMAHETDSVSSEHQITYGAPEGKHDDMVASFLQIAPTMTIVGRRDPVQTEPEAEPVFREGQTTLTKLFKGGPDPFRRSEDAVDSWRSVVLPPGY